MALRIFIPDFTEQFDKPYTNPLFYPFLRKDKTRQELRMLYGEWIEEIEIVESLGSCDIVVMLYEVGYYYKRKKVGLLKDLNRQFAAANKLTICWTKGDEGITPHLQHFHLFRTGGYRSKNKGNQFVAPVFIDDPLLKYLNNDLQLFRQKTAKPIVGFCGQGVAGMGKLTIDVARGVKTRLLKSIHQHYLDLEVIGSSTYRRAKILDELQRSSLIDTNFIRHAKYRGGVDGNENKEESSKAFFKNMVQSQYIVCYRGAGNFSVRLYETLACGRIPIIIESDNNLPFEDEIDWTIFPVIKQKEWRSTPAIVSNFHDGLTDQSFFELQCRARKIYEAYISYKGFMTHWVKRYKQPYSTSQKYVSANTSH